MRSESDEQIALFAWASTYSIPQGKLGHFMFAIPNEGKRSRQHGAKMKAQGLRSGVPDICLALPANGKPGLFIEMKREKGGTVTDNQKKWLARLQIVGYVTAVCKGCAEAKATITKYLEGCE